MKRATILLGLMSISLAPTQCLSQSRLIKLLKSQIDSLYTVDQQVQQDIINEKLDSVWHGLFQRQLATLKQHKPYLAAIINQHGFPGYNLVGKETSNHFFILIQHCDDDPFFSNKY